MQIGDPVKLQKHQVETNPWLASLFRDEVGQVGLVVKTFPSHHCVVLFAGKERHMSKTYLEVLHASR